MTDTRTVVIGMNNPHSEDPEQALAPYPKGVAGQRLHDMLAEVRPDTFRSVYMRGFDRRNMLIGRVWSLGAARQVAPALWQSLEGRRVLLLGVEVLSALKLPQVPALAWQRSTPSLFGGAGPERWCYVPHPSGLNRWYNFPVHRAMVGMRLEQELERWMACQGDDPVT